MEEDRSEEEYSKIAQGDYVGCVMDRYAEFQDVGILRNLAARVKGEVKVLAEGRHRVVVLPYDSGAGPVKLAVKCFEQQSGWKDLYDKKRGSKASRSFEASRRLCERGVGTPDPVAFVDRWEGNRLVESYFFSVYAGELSCFRDELIHLYREDPDCHRLVALLSAVGKFVRKMHDAGFYHRDLGNQNIMVRRVAPGEWVDFQVIDLNRGRLRDELTMEERGRDFDRMLLTDMLLVIVMEEYWQGFPPSDFKKAVEKYRGSYQRRVDSSKWRHPFRSRIKKDNYPEPEDIWIWDERSAQTAIVMLRKERKKKYPSGSHRDVLLSALKAVPGVWSRYQRLLKESYQKEVDLKGHIGMSLEMTGMDLGRQRGLLGRLGKVPVLVRFCHHESEEQWEKTAGCVKALYEDGHSVMLAILQDRRAVKEPESWGEFLKKVIGMTHEWVEVVEVCHAVNRVKWGVWSAREQAQLMEPVVGLQKEFPKLCFTGPAGIDFEYHYVLGALNNLPEGLNLGALSHHLYVDRRGAPENFQGKFSLLEKCALLKAIASWSNRCGDELIVSEVNWPLEGTGVWSPVDGTYLPSWRDLSELNVSEDLYGAYMLRYYVIALCSGMVEKVYWWRLVAHGFGLVDDRAEGGWRERAGYGMLRYFLELLGEATFVEKMPDEGGEYLFKFRCSDGQCVMAWANGESMAVPSSLRYREARDSAGNEVAGEVKLEDCPVYFLGVE